MSSVLRRYTPPTCTLEIAAKGSPLSRWTDRPVLKNLRFQLSFDDPKLSPEQQVKLRGDRAQLERLRDAVDLYVQHILNRSPESLSSDANGQSTEYQADPTSDEVAIYLQPKGLVSHELHLGTLATEESGSTVRLSALQLFDLANALDDYAIDTMALPSLGRSGWLKIPTGGSLRVAAIALLALGTTAAVTKFVMDVASPQAVQTASTAVPQESAPSSSLTQLPDVPSGQIPELAALPDASKTAPPPLGVQSLPTPTSNTGQAISALPTIPVPQRPPVSAPPPQAVRTIPQPAAPRSQTVQIPSGSGASTTAPTPANRSSSPSNQAPVALSIPEQARVAQESGAGQASDSPVAGVQEVPENNSTSQLAAANSTAFDTIPQVGEVRRYFQESWQPPQGLNQTLEYRLRLNSDGSIQQITPLGEAAGTFVDRTNMPLTGEPFVSPIDGGQTPQIRLVLRPDGGVQTFLDPSN